MPPQGHLPYSMNELVSSSVDRQRTSRSFVAIDRLVGIPSLNWI
ncbi:hypothetical protein CGRA01v4_02759 [Colletotrichum graminicola]|nr:hypothetical protein CGRA01v4_02759 [Colletotrichum graminicola]